MKVVVTGADGKVGSAIVPELLAHGIDVVALTRTRWKKCPVRQVAFDLVDFERVMRELDGCDGVVHCAAIGNPGDDKTPAVFRNNLLADYNIVLASGLLGIQRVVIASSDSALGLTWSHFRPAHPRPHYLPVDEHHPDHPNEAYGMCKVLSERMADGMAERFRQMSIAHLRITHVVDLANIAADANFQKARQDPDAPPWNLWSYIDSRDSAQAFRLALTVPFSGHEVFHVAAPNTRSRVSTPELVDRYFPDVRLTRSLSGFESLEDCGKARSVLGFDPQHVLDNSEQ